MCFVRSFIHSVCFRFLVLVFWCVFCVGWTQILHSKARISNFIIAGGCGVNAVHIVARLINKIHSQCKNKIK